MTASHSYHVQELLRVPFRHKKKVLLFFVATLGVTLFALILMPRTYRSEAQLFVRLGRESVALDPTATTGQTVGLTDSREVEINSIQEVLRSRGLAEKVVDRLGPQQVLGEAEQKKPAASAALNPVAWVKLLLAHGDEISDYERAVNLLQANLHINSPRRTVVIEVGCDARSPSLAQKIVATLLDIYKQEHARINRTAGSVAFFEEQTALLETKLTTATDALRVAKNAGALISIDGQRTMLQQEMSNVEALQLSAEHSIAASKAKIDALVAGLDRLPERLKTDEVHGVANASSDEIRRRLYDLELQEYEARSKFTDEHPLLRQLSEEVAEARATAEKEDRSRTHLTESANPVRTPLLAALANERAELAAATATLAVATKQHGSVLARMKSLNDYETVIVERQRKVDELQAAHRTYVEKGEQSRLDWALAQDRISNVNVAQAPTYVAKAVEPKVMLVLSLGLLLALGGSIGVAAAAEFCDHTLKTAGEAEQILQAPVLLTIPRTSRHRVMSN